MELHQLLESVSDEKSFLTFVEALRKDRELDAAAEINEPSNPYDSTSRGWENTTIASFLEAAQAWAEDTDFGASLKPPPKNSWQRFALFLYCGKIYE
jgi:hypothetical protein